MFCNLYLFFSPLLWNTSINAICITIWKQTNYFLGVFPLFFHLSLLVLFDFALSLFFFFPSLPENRTARQLELSMLGCEFGSVVFMRIFGLLGYRSGLLCVTRAEKTLNTFFFPFCYILIHWTTGRMLPFSAVLPCACNRDSHWFSLKSQYNSFLCPPTGLRYPVGIFYLWRYSFTVGGVH